MRGPLHTPDALGDTFPAAGAISSLLTLAPSWQADPYTDFDLPFLEACGIKWDGYDIARFLSLCEEQDGCLIWTGARSRGRGNTTWYGTFTAHGRSVRAHKFYGVSVLGLRPRTGVHHLDHTCCNSLCVRHVERVPEIVNLKLRWIRVQVGLEDPPEREKLIALRMEQFLLERGRQAFEPEDAEHLWTKWVRPENEYRPDPFDPRFWAT